MSRTLARGREVVRVVWGVMAEESKKKLDVSTAQVAGGALASVTAAFLGSHLGVAGTVGGAALTSITITLGGALYQRSIERTKDKAKVLAKSANLDKLPTKDIQRQSTKRIRLPADPVLPGMLWPGGEHVVDSERKEPATDDGRRGRTRWGILAATSGLVFLLCMLIVTGFEGVSGQPLSGGNGGTTLGRVLGPPQPPKPTRRKSPAPKPPVPAPTHRAPETQATPTQEPSQSTEPTTAPSPTSQPNPATSSTPPPSSGSEPPPTGPQPLGAAGE